MSLRLVQSGELERKGCTLSWLSACLGVGKNSIVTQRFWSGPLRLFLDDILAAAQLSKRELQEGHLPECFGGRLTCTQPQVCHGQRVLRGSTSSCIFRVELGPYYYLVTFRAQLKRQDVGIPEGPWQRFPAFLRFDCFLIDF